jgi:hypothetical protein
VALDAYYDQTTARTRPIYHPMKKLLNRNRPVFVGALALSLAIVFVSAQLLPPRTAVEINDLQGHWEGEGAGGKCSITITNNLLHYRAGTNWFKNTFTLPPNTNPQQLHATIKESSPPTNNIGQAVTAIVKIENDTLTIATYFDDPPESFADAGENSLYILKKVQKKNAESLKTSSRPPANAPIPPAGTAHL